MKRQNRLFVILFFIVTFFLFVMIVGAKALFKQTIRRQAEETRNESIVEIDWEQRYPYDTLVDEVKYDANEGESSRVAEIEAKIKNISTLGNTWIKLLYYYADISKVGYVINSFLTDPSVGDSYIKTRNGYWMQVESKRLSLDEAKEGIAPYATLQKYVEDKGIDFLYFYTPSKLCAVDPQLPYGVVTYTNDNIDAYLNALDYYGIDYVDLRKMIHDDGLDHYSLFFKTDHHWTVESGLWCASEIAKLLNEQYGYPLSGNYDLENYELITYEGAEFGSQGEGVTRFVADPEDFSIPIPKFETNYRIEVPNKGVDVSGAMSDIFIDHEGIKEMGENDGGSAYELLMYGNVPYAKITNLDNPNGPKVFMIKDSFSIAVVPYLASSCSELVMVDTRIENGNFTGSIINCINESNPDIVLAFLSEPQRIKINK